jgi:hypothetical protein
MIESYCVESAENLEVDEKGGDGEGQEEGDHEPGTVESVCEKDAAVADSEAGNDDAEGEENA